MEENKSLKDQIESEKISFKIKIDKISEQYQFDIYNLKIYEDEINNLKKEIEDINQDKLK